MKKTAITLSTSLFMYAVVSTASAAPITTSPGKRAVYASDNAAFVGPIADITATISKGAKGRVLEIEASGRVVGCTGTHVAVDAMVNGTAAIFDDMYVEPSTGGAYYSNSHAWWLDIDAAEQNSPGSFVGQPLNITVRANSLNCPDGAFFTGTLRARLVKK